MLRHVVFRGAHADRIWQLAMVHVNQRVTARYVDIIEAHIKATDGRVRQLDLHEPQIINSLQVALAEATVDYFWLGGVGTVPGTRPSAEKGAVPAGYKVLHRTSDYAVHSRLEGEQLFLALEYDAPEEKAP